MALVRDLIRETTATTGTGNIILSGAVAGYGRFQNALSVSSQFHYAIFDGDNREVGLGTLIDATTVARTPQVTIVSGVYDNTSPSPINLSGSAQIAIVSSQDLLQYVQTIDQNLSTIGDVEFNSLLLPNGDVEQQIISAKSIEQIAGQQPSLDLQFDKMGGVLSSAHTLPGIVTFTRASAATYVGADGLIKTAAINTPRFHYDQTTGESKGILIEEQRTNLLLYSQDLSGSAWIESGTASFTINTDTSPDGTLSSDTLSSSGGGSPNYTQQTVVVANDTSSRTLSFFVKKTTSAQNNFGATISYSGGTSISASIAINTNNGSIDLQSNTTATVTEFNQYWRVSFSLANNISGNTSAIIRLYPVWAVNGSGIIDNTISGSSVIWGVQLESGILATSYINTTAAQVTRTSDLFSVSLPNWYRQAKGTLFIDYDIRDIQANSVFMGLSAISGFSDTLYVIRQIGGLTGLFSRINNSTVAAGNFTQSPQQDTNRLAIAFGDGQITASLTNAPPLSFIAGVATDFTVFSIGTAPYAIGTLQSNIRIKRVSYWPARLDDSILQGLTQ